MRMFGMEGVAKAISKWRDWPVCANPGCRATSMFGISKRHKGVRLFEQWFCGPDCFERGAHSKILELLATRRQEKPIALRMPLGLVLLSRGILTHDQVKVALDQQKETGQNFGDVVQQLGFATQQNITAGVAAQWNCPVFSLKEHPVPTEIHIPKILLEQYGMLPVHFSEIGRKLMVGFVSRVHHGMLYTIEQMTSCVAAPCFITANEYRQRLQLLSLSSAENELVFDHDHADRDNATVEIAKLVRNYVNQLGAAEARLGICRDYLWARMHGRQEMDILFRIQND